MGLRAKNFGRRQLKGSRECLFIKIFVPCLFSQPEPKTRDTRVLVLGACKRSSCMITTKLPPFTRRFDCPYWKSCFFSYSLFLTRVQGWNIVMELVAPCFTNLTNATTSNATQLIRLLVLRSKSRWIRPHHRHAANHTRGGGNHSSD